MAPITQDLALSDYQKEVAAYWRVHTTDPVNEELGKVDGLYHHHYGIGTPNPAAARAPWAIRDQEIIKELHRLETAQADLLLDQFGPVEPEDRLFDAGCGRGGTSFMAHARFGCRIDGMTISEVQADFANQQAAERGIDSHVRFHLHDMLHTGFDGGSIHTVWTNETTMYVDLFDLYREFARILRPGGRYVNITGCYNDVLGDKSNAVRTIDSHYLCDVHARSTYFKALAANGLVPVKVVDLTPLTIPYWELRMQSSVRSGIEQPFLSSYRDGSFQYLMIVADRI